jgi:predicted DNA-binding transcriptional regulator AlpA
LLISDIAHTNDFRSGLFERLTMSDRWVSVEEIAKYLGVSKDTVYGWIAKKDLPGWEASEV